MKKKILVYGIGTFFSKVLVFLMVPIYTRVFTRADYGYYDVVTQNLQMIISISFLEIWSGILRFMYDGDEKLSPVNTFKKMFPFLSVLYLIAFGVLYLLTEVKYVPLMLVYGLTYLIFTVSNSECRGFGNNVLFILSGVVSTVTSCGLSILFAVGLHKGIEFLVIAQCIGYMAASIFVELRIHCFRDSFKTKAMVPVRQMVMFCFPLMLNSFSYLFLGTYNKNLVLLRLGEDASGYYGYVSKFATILSILISIYTLAWQEEAFSSAKSENQDSKYSHLINLFVKLVGLGTPIFIMVLFWGSKYYGGAQYVDALKYIPLAIISAYIAGMSGVYSTLIAVGKKTHYILLSTVIGAAVNVAMVTILIDRFGINGANLALCAGFGATVISRMIFASKTHKIKLSITANVVVILEFIVCCVMFMLQYNLMAVIFLAATVAMWIIMNRTEMSEIITRILGMINRKTEE